MINQKPDARDILPLPRPAGMHIDGVSGSLECSQLFEAHFEELTRYAYRYVHSIDEAKDVVHDAFSRLWQQREQVDFRTSARAYLFTTVRHLAIDRVRRHRVRDGWRIRSQQRASAAPMVAPDDPEQDFANQELAMAVADAVAVLPPRQRQVLLLRWHQQASYEEIAKTLGISPHTVGIHVTRALATLRRTLQPFFGAAATDVRVRESGK